MQSLSRRLGDRPHCLAAVEEDTEHPLIGAEGGAHAAVPHDGSCELPAGVDAGLAIGLAFQAARIARACLRFLEVLRMIAAIAGEQIHRVGSVHRRVCGPRRLWGAILPYATLLCFDGESVVPAARIWAPFQASTLCRSK